MICCFSFVVRCCGLHYPEHERTLQFIFTHAISLLQHQYNNHSSCTKEVRIVCVAHVNAICSFNGYISLIIRRVVGFDLLQHATWNVDFPSSIICSCCVCCYGCYSLWLRPIKLPAQIVRIWLPPFFHYHLIFCYAKLIASSCVLLPDIKKHFTIETNFQQYRSNGTHFNHQTRQNFASSCDSHKIGICSFNF